jgi:hypothetical protein
MAGDLDIYYDVPEFTKAQRIDMALRAWEKADGSVFIRTMARKYDICYETLRLKLRLARLCNDSQLEKKSH